MSYQDMEEYSKAVEIYDRLALMEPVKDDVYYNLGLCLGRQNILGLAHYNFGRYFKRIGDRKTPTFILKRQVNLRGAIRISRTGSEKKLKT
jgi:tetratricopeptide (TPR) repeat protein